MRSILVKIVALLFVFNIALWMFYIVSDDFVERELRTKIGRLIVKSLLYAKIAKPSFENKSLSPFERSVEIQNLLTDKRLLGNQNLRIYRFDNMQNLEDYFVFYDRSETLKYAPISIKTLTSADIEKSRENIDFKLKSRLFEYYKPLIDRRILSEQIVTKRARYN